MDHYYEFRYENVYLRPLHISDIESLMVWRNEPKNTTYLSKLPHITSQMQHEWFLSYLQNDNEICFAIFENQSLNRLVGSCSLYDFTGESCLFGKLLIGDEKAHGRRIGVNATHAAVEIAFHQLKMKNVRLFVYGNNKAAMKVYQKAGFGIIDKHIGANGETEYTMIIERGQDSDAQHE